MRSVKRFILFHGRHYRTELGERRVAGFLSHLAVEGYVAAATQNQALNALASLYPRGRGRLGFQPRRLPPSLLHPVTGLLDR